MPSISPLCILHFGKAILFHHAQGTDITVGEIFPLCAGSYIVFRFAGFLVINVAAYITDIFHAQYLLLAEVALQESLEGSAVTGFVTGHFMRQAASVLPLEGHRETQNAYKSKHFQEKLEGKRVKSLSTFHRANSIKSFLKKSTFPLLEGLT